MWGSMQATARSSHKPRPGKQVSYIKMSHMPYMGARRPEEPVAATAASSVTTSVKMGRCILAYARPGNLILTASAS